MTYTAFFLFIIIANRRFLILVAGFSNEGFKKDLMVLFLQPSRASVSGIF